MNKTYSFDSPDLKAAVGEYVLGNYDGKGIGDFRIVERKKISILGFKGFRFSVLRDRSRERAAATEAARLKKHMAHRAAKISAHQNRTEANDLTRLEALPHRLRRGKRTRKKIAGLRKVIGLLY